MTAPRDPDRMIHSFLLEGAEQLHDQVYDAVRAEIEQRRQRATIGPWRMPNMNKFVPIGVGAAAVVVVLVAGTRLLGAPAPAGVGAAPPAATQPAPSPTSNPSPAAPSPSLWIGLPEGPFAVTGADDPVQVTVDIASSGWTHVSDLDYVHKNDDGLDAPQTVGGALLAWAWPAGTGFSVYGDACRWSTGIPAASATTPDEFAAAFAAQVRTEATAPVDVTVGGYAGKAITLTVPMTYEVPGATREEEFGDCDQDIFGFYAAEREAEPSRNAQGPGQIDELWILDVDGSIVILDAAYSPATPADLVEQMRTMAESATFDLP